MHPFRLVIHGGAGALIDQPDEAERREVLAHALREGHAILAAGGSAMDAVVVAVAVLEDSPLFNAGTGSVLTRDGKVEMDAAVMDGATLSAGAVAGVTRFANPVRIARAVMDHTPHVLLVGAGAEGFALAHGIPAIDPAKLITTHRREELAEKLTAEKFGTVGAVALDSHGHLAAATSTGGMVGKLPGRVGDSPLIGAGTYASGEVAVSGTGAGEMFIRAAVAHEVNALVRHKGLPVTEAADRALADALAIGGRGGLIAVARDGSYAMPFNTAGMNRGTIDELGEPWVAIAP